MASVLRAAAALVRWLVIAICFPLGLAFLFFPSPRKVA